MDTKRIAELRALLAGTTDWYVDAHDSDPGMPNGWDVCAPNAGARETPWIIATCDEREDADAICRVRNEADDLLGCAERVEKLERVVETARALVAHEDDTAMVCDLCGERVCIGECPVGGLRVALRDLDAKGG